MYVRQQVKFNFRRLRAVFGLAQEQTAEKTGVSQQCISDIEQEKRNSHCSISF